MSDDNGNETGLGMSNLTLGLLLALFVVLWFLTAIVWVYFSSPSV